MTTTKVLIEMAIEGDPQDAYNVIDAMLDNGDPQDTINDHEHDGAGPLHVKSAVCRIVGPVTLDENGCEVGSAGWLKLFVDAQMEQATAAGHGYAEGAADYRGRVGDVDAGLHSADWAWPLEGAEEAYLSAVGVGTIARSAGIDPERWDVVSKAWSLAFWAGYTEAHDADEAASGGFAAIGDDGMRPVVWGMAITEGDARANAVAEARQGDCETGPLTVRPITRAQARRISAGEVDAVDLGLVP